MAFLIGSGIICILAGLRFVIIGILSRNPRNLFTTTGKLTKSDTVRNVHGKRGIIPIWTTYTYKYTVNGREYKYHGQNRRHRKHLLNKIKLVYVKGFPRHVFPEKFDTTGMWILGVWFMVMGIIVLLILPF